MTATARVFRASRPEGNTADRIVDFVRLYTVTEGWAPTVREISDAVGRATSTVHRHLQALERDGRIERMRYSPRAIRLMPR